MKNTNDSGNAKNARLVSEYVRCCIAERITVGDIARELGVNASYLNASFRRHTGECITQYIQRRKAAVACEMLEETTMSLTEIWTALGYFDQSHFTRQFKKIYGCPPGTYRSRINDRKE